MPYLKGYLQRDLGIQLQFTLSCLMQFFYPFSFPARKQCEGHAGSCLHLIMGLYLFNVLRHARHETRDRRLVSPEPNGSHCKAFVGFQRCTNQLAFQGRKTNIQS